MLFRSLIVVSMLTYPTLVHRAPTVMDVQDCIERMLSCPYSPLANDATPCCAEAPLGDATCCCCASPEAPAEPVQPPVPRPDESSRVIKQLSLGAVPVILEISPVPAATLEYPDGHISSELTRAPPHSLLCVWLN